MNDKFKAERDNLNDSTKEQPEKAQEADNIPNEQNNLTQTLDSENMEVHHHSSHSHGKKTWRTYGWEFGMLFLAVFCGFLAEYFLEHRIEKEKGTQYVLSMIADLESDAAKIDNALLELKTQGSGLDSLSLLCSNTPYNDSIIKHMYQLMFNHTTSVSQIRFTKRTMTQLANSGGMRLISNKASADAITEYAGMIEGVESQGKYYVDHGMGEIMDLNKKIFNLQYMRVYFSKNRDRFFMESNAVKLVNDDKKLMAEYSNLNLYTSKVVSFYIQKISDLQEQIPKTIAILKKENHIK